MAGKYNLHWL